MGFHAIRRAKRIESTDSFEGVNLEGLPASMNGARPGVVLTHKDWDNIYFLRVRPNWVDDDYFMFAELKFKELNIDPIEKHGKTI